MTERSYYNYGNTARELEPIRRNTQPRRENPYREEPNRQEPRRKSQSNQQVKRSRLQQGVINKAYVTYLVCVVAILGVAFMGYLRMESSNASRSSNITSLQQQLSDLKMENDAALSSIENSVDLDQIKIEASNLGMVYISNSQMIEYQSPTADYVIQYEEIPASGVLAQSDSVTK